MRTTDTGDLRPLIALLKALWRLRPPGGTEPTGARLVRRWREKRLLAQLERKWSGGFCAPSERRPRLCAATARYARTARAATSDLVKIDVEGHERQVLDGARASLALFSPVLVLETGHEADGDRQAIHDLLGGLGYRMLGLLLDFGMAEAGWPAYVAVDRPFRPGNAHNLLFIQN